MQPGPVGLQRVVELYNQKLYGGDTVEKVTRYKTIDGKLFKTHDEAMHHLDVMYSNRVSEVAARIIDNTSCKYQALKTGLMKT